MTGLDKDEMFRDLSPNEPEAGERAAPTGKKDDYTPVIPVPEDAPAPDWNKLRPQEATGDPVKIWTYHTAEGGVAFYVARWLPKDPDDDKVIRPATWDGSKWRLKGMPAPRPLYRLPDNPKYAGPVVVVEGEKCADGAHDAFAFQLVTTWSGGCRALNRTNWQPLAGREVLLVADADDSGRKAMEALAQHLHSLGCKVRIYFSERDDGKDIFDWIEADGADDVRERIDAGAKPWPPMDWKDELAERAKSDPGAPFEPDMLARLAELRRDNAAEWQRLLRKLREAKVMIGDLKAAMAATESRDSDGLQRRSRPRLRTGRAGYRNRASPAPSRSPAQRSGPWNQCRRSEGTFGPAVEQDRIVRVSPGSRRTGM